MDQQSTQDRDPQLWQLAQRRAAFKRHLASYVTVNIFLWLIWLFTNGNRHYGLPWPIWPTLGWGIAIVLQYINAYMGTGYGSAEKEYETLKQQSYKK